MELRKDYLLDRWVIIASNRNKRPKQFVSHSSKEQTEDFFAPGNEEKTPPEIGRVPDGDSWKMRWFSNKFPFVEPQGNPTIETDNEFFTFSGAFGHHEVIVETPGDEQLWDLSQDDLSQLFQIYKHRIEELSKQEHMKYVMIFKNHGKEAGTSLVHSHTQVAALNLIPPLVKEELQACKEQDKYEQIILTEHKSLRKCFENDKFVAFCPYASRSQYEISIFPKQFKRSLTECDENEMQALAWIMKQVLEKLKELNAPFNYYLHYAPNDELLRFHIEIHPRLSTWAGFELGSAIIVNAVSPEDAASFYRGENKIGQ